MKLYFGNAHYTHPLWGNARRLIKNRKYINSISLFLSSSLFVSLTMKHWEKQNKIDNFQPILCKLPIIQYYPTLLQIITKWFNNRYKVLQGTTTWKKTNQLQINSYAPGGKIQPHFDSSDWFSQVLLYKVIHNSGVHLSAGPHGHVWNPYLFHPLPEGSILRLTKWSHTWYKHSRAPWMSAPGGSVTAIFRFVRENATFYPYPQPLYGDLNKLPKHPIKN